MSLSRSLLFSTALVASVPSVLVHAGEFTVGFGGVAFEAPYKQFKDDDGGYLVFGYEGEDFMADTEGLHYRVIGNEQSPLSLAISLASTGTGFKASDSVAFAGMSERDSSIDLGLSANYQLNDAAAISAAVLHDISGTHKGFVADLTYSYSIEMYGKSLFTPEVGINYLSKDYTDYYYGVRENEATAQRAAYKAGATTNFYAGYSLEIPLNESWTLEHHSSYIWLGDDIEKSSLVDRSNSWFTTLGVSYRF